MPSDFNGPSVSGEDENTMSCQQQMIRKGQI